MGKIQTQKGFTIIELMIAISVFSIILLICISSIIYVGRLYYLGVSIAKTQEVARTTIDTISDSVKFSGLSVDEVTDITGDWDGAFCIGSRKYSYKLGQVLLDTAQAGEDQTTEALVESLDTACGTTDVDREPIYSDPTNPDLPPAKELLGKYMRLNSFEITTLSVGSRNLVTIRMSIVYGGDGTNDDREIFNYDTFSPDPDVITSCKTGVGGSNFCGVSNLVKTVYGI